MPQKRIVIDPVTRIEGHSKISLHLDEQGRVQEAYFHVTQFRGFEKFGEGRPFYEIPSLMARICGICPVSHLIASAKACDAILGVRIPETAVKLRKIMNLAQIVQSHALSFFYLSSPDLLLGMDADPAERHLFGVAEKHPELARDGVALRRFGQQIIEWLGGKRIHPSWVVAGGVNEKLTEERRDRIMATIPEALATARRTLDWFKKEVGRFREEVRTFANFPTMFMSLVDEQGQLAFYDGKLRFMDAAGRIVADKVDAADYDRYLGEFVNPWSYLKTTYYKPSGYPAGIYRVGPLARLNVTDGLPAPLAAQEWAEFRELGRGAVLSSFYYHYARLVEIVFSIESMQALLESPGILSPRVRAFARHNNDEGIGISEAPRGTLLHHYKVDEEGLLTWANLIIATGHNNSAMNRGVLQVAKHFVHGSKLQEGMLNRVEALIRAFDPCLSCSTHADGRLALRIELRDAGGSLLDQLSR
jgi:NAD-reducing hydrogenase large subunit